MKRYQCIKNFYMEATGELAFKAGDTYSADKLIFKSRVSDRHVMSRKNVELHFQELLDLHVDDVPNEQYENPMERSSSQLQAERGCAWIVVGVITVCALVYLVITWRS